MAETSNKSVMTEQQGYITGFNDSYEVRPGCLGKLTGIIADYGNPTKNGRFYSRELWDSVFSDEDVLDLLKNKVLFGEVDHPADRLETKVINAAVVLTSYEFDDTNRLLKGEFDILDTPGGRVVQALARYGCKLGVSSRGVGETHVEYDDNNEEYEVIDPESYYFVGFDVVSEPAVASARQDYISESVDKPLGYKKNSVKSYIECLTEQVKSLKSVHDLKVIKNIFSNSTVNSKSLNKLIEEKENELGSVSVKSNCDGDNTIVSTLADELKKASETIIDLKTKLQDNTIVDEDRTSEEECTSGSEEDVDDAELLKLVTEYEDEIDDLKSKLESLASTGSYYKNKYLRSARDNSNVESLKSNLAAKSSKIAKDHKYVCQLESIIDGFKSYTNKLVDENTSIKNKNSSLIKENARLTKTNDSLSVKNVELAESLQKVRVSGRNIAHSGEEIANAYVKLKCKVSGISESSIPRVHELSLNKINEAISTAAKKHRSDKLVSNLSEGKHIVATLSADDDTPEGSSLTSMLNIMHGN